MVCIFITYEKWGSPVVDCFRNAYVAEQLTTGKLLYQHIFYQYGPLIPYLNALLFKIFGINLKILYFSGICVSFSIVILTYVLSRLFVSAYKSLLVTLLIISICIFASDIYQFIFPYCYEAIYGCLLSLLLIVNCVISIKNKKYNVINLMLPAIIASILTLIKQDFAIAIYLTLYLYYIICFIENKSNKKYIAYSFILSVILPILYYGIVSLYVSPETFISNLFPRLNFYSSIPRLPFVSLDLLIETLSKACFFLLLSFLTAFIVFYLTLLFYIPKSRAKYVAFFILIIFLVIVFSFNSYSSSKFLLKYLAHPNFFQWLGIFLLCYLGYNVIYAIKKNNSPLNNNLPVLFLTFASIVLLFRSLLSVSSMSSSNFNVLPGFVVLNYFIMTLVDNFKSDITRKSANVSISILLILIIGANFTNNYKEYSLLNMPIKSSRGVIFSKPEYANPLNQTINYLIEHTTHKDTILTIPDEVIINFMSSRNTPSRYYQFLPCYNDSFYEPKIISELKRNNPRFIIITNNSVGLLYNGKIWGANYNKKLSSWIHSNYTLTKSFGTKDSSKDFNYIIYLFEKKSAPLDL